ncbi:hypothetical protein PVAND_007208 [Polypedilum vanderplanki]|uniref:Sodium/nucleoside cotransporter n=1 Tax=Polypedilum vanderplanki TaxID=319348 RepID=A0A9J6C5Z3_POLVA|nr:hypothetical protein PVAND_007208 [Polypedilum vanderplanki]
MNGVQNEAFDLTENLNKFDRDDRELNKHKTNGENISLEPMTHEEVVNTNLSATGTNKNEKKYSLVVFIITNFIVFVYFSYVTYHYIKIRNACEKNCELTLCSPYGMLLFVISAIYLGLIYYKLIKPYFGKTIEKKIFKPVRHNTRKFFKSMQSRVAMSIVLSATFFAYIIYETFNDFTRLRALVGIAIFITIGYSLSIKQNGINYRIVICGAIFQFLLGVILIRWTVGREIFSCFGEKISQFLNYGKHGAAFVFGDFLVTEKIVFAFAVLPIIYFFSMCISVGYYLGFMQQILFKIGWILQSIIGTTVCESVNAAGNIFLGMSESPLVIQPYIKHLTHSEIHAIMVSGFATVSGSVMAAYINFGAEPSHLITASVMAAPASLFMAKLVWPETEETKTSSNNIQIEKSTDTSIIDAASNGASNAINLMLNIIANLVAFVSFIYFADAILTWITTLAGFENLNLHSILGKIFMPISWLIGIDWKDCENVGHIIGTKTIINEFVAFKLLGEYKAAGKISSKSAAITTYAICSFANPASIGIMIGALSGLAPERRPSITKVAIRAFFAACLVTLITASIAGLLMTDETINNF